MFKYVLLVLFLCCNHLYGKELSYEHAVAANLIAKYQTLTQSPDIGPVKPKVGDKCPQCNNPPGKCGVGKVGDGVICDICLECNGDGRIDEKDLNKNLQADEKTTNTKNGTVTMYTSDGCVWCVKWEKEVMPKLMDANWKIEKVYVSSGSVPRFTVYANNKQYEHTGFMSVQKFNEYVKKSKE